MFNIRCEYNERKNTNYFIIVYLNNVNEKFVDEAFRESKHEEKKYIVCYSYRVSDIIFFLETLQTFLFFFDSVKNLQILQRNLQKFC